MKRMLHGGGLLKMIGLAVSALSASALLLACTAASAPAPTTKPAAQPATAPAPTTKPAAQPATVPAPAQPTAAPSVKVAYPEKGKTIIFVVPFPAGGGLDTHARLTAPYLEKELGVSIQVLNKVGAGGQVGVTEVARSKPDGYTVLVCDDQSIILPYLDPSRGAAYGRKDMVQVVRQVLVPLALAVNSQSPYKTAKDLVDEMKAKPNELRVSVTGVMSDIHLAVLGFRRAAGVSFRTVQFDGAAQASTALLGNHIEAVILSTGGIASHIKTGAVRMLGLMEKERHALYPEVPTLREQGYDAVFMSTRGYHVPAGTPKEIVEVLHQAVKKVMDNPELKEKMLGAGQPPAYLGSAEYTAAFDEAEAVLKPLAKEALEEQKK